MEVDLDLDPDFWLIRNAVFRKLRRLATGCLCGVFVTEPSAPTC